MIEIIPDIKPVRSIMKSCFSVFVIAVFIGNGWLLEISLAQNGNLEKDAKTTIQGAFRNVAEVKDSDLIQLILDDFFIPEDISQIERVEIFDVSNAGFGSQNVLIIYPSRNIYIIERPSSEALSNEMQNWRLQDQRRDADNSLEADYFYPGNKDSVMTELENSGGEISLQNENELAINALISDLLSSLSRNYQDTTISLRFERDQDGFTFQIWGYNDGALTYNERPVIQPDTVILKEIITEVIRDTIVFETEGIQNKYNVLDKKTENLGEDELPVTSTVERSDLTKFNFSILNAFLDYHPISETPFDTLYSYHPGFGIEIGYSFEPRFLFLSLGTGGMYHPGKSFETTTESQPFRDPEQTVIRSFNGFHLYGISNIGLDFVLKNRYNLKLFYTFKYGVYYPIEDNFDYEPEPVITTFIGVNAGLQNPAISFFIRQSLITQMNIDSIHEYGVTLRF